MVSERGFWLTCEVQCLTQTLAQNDLPPISGNPTTDQLVAALEHTPIATCRLPESVPELLISAREALTAIAAMNASSQHPRSLADVYLAAIELPEPFTESDREADEGQHLHDDAMLKRLKNLPPLIWSEDPLELPQTITDLERILDIRSISQHFFTSYSSIVESRIVPSGIERPMNSSMGLTRRECFDVERWKDAA